MKAAASNSAGAMTGFMGMGMAANAGGLNAQQLFEMGQKQQAQQQSVQQQAAQPVSPAGNGVGAAAGSWTCSCGAVFFGEILSGVLVHRVRWRTAGPVPAVR